MANEENLIPQSNRTKSEQREIAKKAGKASGEARRNKKLLREYATLLLALPVKNEKQFNNLRSLGIPDEDINNKMVIIAALWIKASQGDVAAIREFMNILDESGEQKARIAAVKAQTKLVKAQTENATGSNEEIEDLSRTDGEIYG